MRAFGAGDSQSAAARRQNSASAEDKTLLSNAVSPRIRDSGNRTSLVVALLCISHNIYKYVSIVSYKCTLYTHKGNNNTLYS